MTSDTELQAITTVREDDAIAVVRYVTSDVDDDGFSLTANVTVYVGGIDDINTAIQHDAEGSDQINVDDVTLLWSDRDAAEFGFDNAAEKAVERVLRAVEAWSKLPADHVDIHEHEAEMLDAYTALDAIVESGGWKIAKPKHGVFVLGNDTIIG